jgi:hypothetical protein
MRPGCASTCAPARSDPVAAVRLARPRRCAEKRNHLRRPGRGRRSPPGDGLPGEGSRCWRGGVVGGGWGGLPDPAIRDDANMAQTDPGGVYDAEHAENGRWAWFWTSPGGATFDSAAIYATKEAALYAARAWVKRRYKG